MARRLRAALVVALAASGLLTPGAAAADPAGPTDARSRVVDVRPRPDGARIEVVGGDALLQLTVEPGHDAVVPGYGGEPYLRFDDDGVIEVNRRSPATYVNGNRQGGTAVPAEADPDAPPQWDRVASRGTYTWHDHRIHWMGDEGELTSLPKPVPVPAAALGTGALVAVLLVDRRRHPASLAALTALGAAAVAVVLGWGNWSVQPTGVDADPLLVAVPILAELVAALALVPRLQARRQVLVLAAVALVGGWALLQLPALWHAIVPSQLAAPAVRAGLALVAGLVAAAAVLGVRPSHSR